MKKLLFLLIFVVSGCAPKFAPTEGPFRVQLGEGIPRVDANKPFQLLLHLQGQLPPRGAEMLMEISLDGQVMSSYEGSFIPQGRYVPLAMQIKSGYWCERAKSGAYRDEWEDALNAPYVDIPSFPDFIPSSVEVKFYFRDAAEDKWIFAVRAERRIRVFCTECTATECKQLSY